MRESCLSGGKCVESEQYEKHVTNLCLTQIAVNNLKGETRVKLSGYGKTTQVLRMNNHTRLLCLLPTQVLA